MHPFTGPWRIVASLPGASYKLKFTSNPKRRKKKHASNLFPYPPELIPFQPVNEPDNQYSQLYKPIGKSPYKEAGIKGFDVVHFVHCGNFHNFHFPVLSKLNNKFEPFPWLNDDKQQRYMSNDVVEMEPILYNAPPPSPAVIQVPSIPPISILVRSHLTFPR
jgi:hypothetical protein